MAASRVLVVLSSLVIAGLASPRCFAQENPDEWQFSATVYGWLPDIGGHTDFGVGGGQTIDIDVSKILDNLKMTFQGSFEVHKGHWGAFTDLVYLDVGASKSQTRNLEFNGNPLPAAVTADVDLDLKSTIWTIAASYRAVGSETVTVDVLFGARLTDMQQSFDWEFTGTFGAVTPPPLTGSRDGSVDHWDAIAGVKGRFAFGANHKWVVPYYLDIGTGDSDFAWQGVLGLAYEFGWGDLGVAWRYLDYDLGDGPITEMNFNGPAAGATFRW
jgi:hypothetical protein